MTRCRAHDYDDPGKPAIAWDDKAARVALVSALVTDALAVIGALADAEVEGKAAEAVALLALVAGQDVEPAEGSDGTDGQWRIARKVAPDWVISTVDPDRHVHKTCTTARTATKDTWSSSRTPDCSPEPGSLRPAARATTRPWSGWTCSPTWRAC